MIELRIFGHADPLVIIESAEAETVVTFPFGRDAMMYLHSLARRQNLRVCYPSISDEFVVFQDHFKEKYMDLAAQIALVDAHENAEEKKLGLETVFIAPNPTTLPDDGVLTYLVVASVYDLKLVSPGTVVLVDPDFSPSLKLVAEHPLTFGLKVIVLTGLPTAEYSSAFDSATWNCDKVSYAGLIADINESRLAKQADSAANASQSEKEKASFTRADGSVKGHQAMVFKTDDVAEEPSDEES